MSFPLEMRRFHPVIFNKFIKRSSYIKEEINEKSLREKIRILPNKKSSNLMGMPIHLNRNGVSFIKQKSGLILRV